MAELVLRLRVAGNQEVQNALQALGQQAANVQAKVVQSGQGADRAGVDFNRLGRAASNVGALLSGTAAIASTFARGNKELQERLQSFSLVMASGSAVVRTFGAALQLVGKGPIGLIILGLGAAVTATVLLIRHWEQAKESALRVWGAVRDFFARVFDGIATTFRGLGQIIIGVFRRDMEQIQAGADLLREGLGQLKDTAVDLGTGIKNLTVAGWEKLSGLFKQTGDAAEDADKRFKAMIERAREVGEAVALLIKGHRFEVDPGQRLHALPKTVEQLKAELLAAGKAWQGMSSEASRFLRLGPSFKDVEVSALGDAAILIEQARAVARTGFPEIAQGMLDRAIPAFEALGEAGNKAIATLLEAISEFGSQVPETFATISSASTAASTSIQSQWTQSIGDMLTGAKSFGEAMTQLFEGIKQTIIRKIAEAFADKVWDWAKGLKLSKVLPFPFNIIAGFIGLQHGGIVTRPTLAMVGEAGPEAVVPLNQARSMVGTGLTVVVQVQGDILEADPWKWDQFAQRFIAPAVARQLRLQGVL